MERFVGTGGVIFLSHSCNDSESDVSRYAQHSVGESKGEQGRGGEEAGCVLLAEEKLNGRLGACSRN